MPIDKNTVSYVAHLARVELTAQELEVLSGQLKSIIDFIDQLKELDVQKVAATSHILPVNNVLRQDAPRPSLPLDKALQNAPRKEGGFFSVPKVIE